MGTGSRQPAVRSGFQDTEFVADARERVDRPVQVLATMGRRQPHADARLSLRHDRKEEPDRVDTLLQQKSS
jgi:hypothetical protein